jgi:osmotically-inducible protein OsmY
MLMLQSCFNIATSGATAVYNRHSLQRNFKDQYTTLRINQALNIKTSEFSNANITVAMLEGEVLLAGQVPSAWQKEKAESIVKKIPNVKTVYNLITVASPSSTMTRISDAWITAKVKARLMASDDVDASQLKVVTENGSVYLMGTLKVDEADAAAEIASATDGVQRVVKIFSYVTISKRPERLL